MEPLNEEQVKKIILELVGEEEIYGVTWNDDASQLQARVLIDGLPYLQTFIHDKDTGKYYLASDQPLGQQKL